MFLKDKNKDLGVNLNVSFVGNDEDGYTGGAHVTVSDGTDISVEANGSTPTQVADALTMKIVLDVLDKKMQSKKDAEEKTKKARAEKEAKLDALYNHVDQLEEEISNLESELYDAEKLETSEPIDDHITLDDLFGSDKDDFFDYLDSLLK